MEQIEYKIIRSKRKTLSLTVTREGEIVVRSPQSVSKEYIADFVRKHESWIEKRLVRVSMTPKLDLSDGGELLLFGSNYRIQTGRTRMENGKIYLPQEKREAALARLLKKFALDVMGVLTERIASRYGFQYRRVRISSARGRWGSCNKEGIIAYTFRIAFLSPALCEYVAVHELAHTVRFDHSAEFWDIVENILPDWKNRRKMLKTSGAMAYL